MIEFKRLTKDAVEKIRDIDRDAVSRQSRSFGKGK